MANSIYTGKVNDDYKYSEVATQDDFALFKDNKLYGIIKITIAKFKGCD